MIYRENLISIVIRIVLRLDLSSHTKDALEHKKRLALSCHQWAASVPRAAAAAAAAIIGGAQISVRS